MKVMYGSINDGSSIIFANIGDNMPKVSEEYFEKKRREIIDAAYQVCLEKPLPEIVLQDITDKAGFSHGLIYKYYKNIDEILYELFARINSEVDIEAEWKKVLDSTNEWKEVIRKSCNLMKETLTSMELEKLKISVYANAMSVSNPERTLGIISKMDNYGRSPLYDLVAFLRQYLTDVIQEESLHPTEPLDAILQFMFISVSGFQIRYTISECYQSNGGLDPDEIFSCLAASLISMIGGTKD